MTDSARPTLAPPFQRIAAGGCRVAVVSRPDERRACLIVEVAAGSHDEPPAWPGLAHFLEHLLFLGGEGYPAERRLLPFVQASGGRVNASTGARLTEYHCEVPAELLEEAGLRLLDMLARPRLDADAQLAEAQVLEAEYLARGADPRQQGLCALLDALALGHPCHAFVAGNGASLAPRRDDFRATVADFHRRFYRAGNCRLMLVGPQPAPELLALGERLAALLIPGEAPVRSVPPAMLPLCSHHWHLGQASAAPRLWLGLALEGRAEGARAALGWLREQISSDLPGSLQQQLREAGLIDGWDVQSAYAHAGQALLALEVEPVADDDRACAQVRAALLRWLSAFAARAPWREALATQAAERPWQLAALAPLELGRFWLEQGAGQPDGDALRNLAAMLAGVGEERLSSVRASALLAPGPTSVCGAGGGRAALRGGAAGESGSARQSVVGRRTAPAGRVSFGAGPAWVGFWSCGAAPALGLAGAPESAGRPGAGAAPPGAPGRRGAPRYWCTKRVRRRGLATGLRGAGGAAARGGAVPAAVARHGMGGRTGTQRTPAATGADARARADADPSPAATTATGAGRPGRRGGGLADAD